MRRPGHDAGTRTISQAPCLLAAFAVVIASFLTSSVYAQQKLLDLDRDTAAIARAALPDMTRLAVLRTRLRQLDAALTDVAAEPSPRHRDVAERSARDLATDAAVEALASRPSASALADLGVVRTASAAVLAAEERHDQAAARGALERARGAIESADLAIAAALDTEARQADHDGARMDSQRRDLRWRVLALDAGCFAFSVPAALVASTAVRRAAVRAEQRSRELEAFASRVAHDVRGP